jgi:type I restriction enzyme S subunit
MSAVEQLITDNLDIWSSVIKKRGSQGRGSSKKIDLYGIKVLRTLILELAFSGSLVSETEGNANSLFDSLSEIKNDLIARKILKKTRGEGVISESEVRLSIPANWRWVRLGDVFDVRDGTHDSPKYQTEGYPLVTSKNIYSGQLDLSNVKYISEEDHLKISERSKVDKGDILFAMIGSIGNPVIIDVDPEFSVKNVGLFKYYDSKQSNPRYLQYYLKLAETWFKEEASGAVQSFVSLGKLRSYPFPLSSLEEQSRIVAKVDELMALCDQLEQQQENSISAHQTLVETLLAALTNAGEKGELTAKDGGNAGKAGAFSGQQAWARIAEHFDTLFTTEHSVDQLKQTILQLAVMGKLVPQDPNDEPASVLLEKIAAEKELLVKDKKIKKQKALPPIGVDEKSFELPEGWEWCRIAEFGVVGTGATPSRTNTEYFQPADVNWVTSGETGNDFVFETKEKVSYKAIYETNVSIYPEGTLVVAMYGQGKTRGQITELMVPAGTNQACAAIQLIQKSEAHRKYTKLYFQKAYDELRSHSAGGAQPNLNVGKISLTVLSIPPHEEQKRIVEKVSRLMSLCDDLKARINESQITQLHLADVMAEQALQR